MESPGFFKRILLPSLLALVLFLMAIYLFVIPGYKENLLDKKRETIRELTNSTWSILQSLHHNINENFPLASAQTEAVSIIGQMRYGPEQKDYFWITDTLPRMIMHPYRPKMEGTNLSEYADSEGKRFFVEIVDLVKNSGEGYIDYKWQWKDDSLVVVPKLSYVKLFEPWGWVIGTGIYVDDVKKEISVLTRQVVWISFFITILIIALIGYLTRKNYMAGMQRQTAQQKLSDTMEKYKKLVEASSDGILMSLEGKIMYCNPYLFNLLGYSEKEVEETDSRFLSSLQCLLQFKPPLQSSDNSSPEIITEHKIRKKNNELADVIITRSEFEMHGKTGYIYTLKDVSQQNRADQEIDQNMDKFKTMADIMHTGMFRCTLGRKSRFLELNKNILQTLGYMSDVEMKGLQIQELFHDMAERKEITRAINNGVVIKNRLLHLKKADGSILPALVSLFPVKDNHERVVYCDGILVDAYEQLSRNTGFRQLPSDEHLSANILLKPVKDFMIEAPLCELNTPVYVASRLMSMRNSDIVLIIGNNKEIVGILTHGDISRRLVSQASDPSLPVSEIMSAPVISVSDKEMVMDAFTLMIQHKVSYVAVKTSGKSCPGYISLLALSELRSDTPEFMVNSIQKAGSTAEIAELMKHLPRLIARLVETGTGAITTGKLISRISDTITEKIIEESIHILGQPPVPFVFLALGSEGRREQTLATDQDNAIIYQPKDNNKQITQQYFLELGKMICTRLDQVGYPFCTGDIMAMNPQWCMSLDSAREKVTQWVNTPNPKELLNAGIFFDFRPIYGDFGLANQLQQYCLKSIKEKSVFFYNMAQNIISLKPPVNVLGQIVYETGNNNKSYLDIKKPVMAITGIIRFWSLKTGINAKNSLERLDALKSVNVLNDSTIEEFRQVLKYLMLIRIKNQLRNLEMGEEPDNLIPLPYLSEMDRTMLKKIFSAIATHQSRMTTEMRIA